LADFNADAPEWTSRRGKRGRRDVNGRGSNRDGFAQNVRGREYWDKNALRRDEEPTFGAEGEEVPYGDIGSVEGEVEGVNGPPHEVTRKQSLGELAQDLVQKRKIYVTPSPTVDPEVVEKIQPVNSFLKSLKASSEVSDVTSNSSGFRSKDEELVHTKSTNNSCEIDESLSTFLSQRRRPTELRDETKPFSLEEFDRQIAEISKKSFSNSSTISDRQASVSPAEKNSQNDYKSSRRREQLKKVSEDAELLKHLYTENSTDELKTNSSNELRHSTNKQSKSVETAEENPLGRQTRLNEPKSCEPVTPNLTPTPWDTPAPHPAVLSMRRTPKTGQEFAEQLSRPIVSPPNSRLLRVAVLGLPNAGKSSLINTLMKHRVCSVSRKVHTTRHVARAALCVGETQVLLLDTPGLVTGQQAARHQLPPPLLSGAEASLAHADCVLLVADAHCRYAALGLHPAALRLLALHPGLPVFLVLNKVDIIKRRLNLLELATLFSDGVVGGTAPSLERVRRHSDEISKRANPVALAARFIRQEEKKSEEIDQECEGGKEENKPDGDDGDGFTSDSLTFEDLLENKFVAPPRKKVTSVVVNDVDVFSGRLSLSEQQVDAFIAGRKGWPKFQEVFMASALTGEGTDAILSTLLRYARPSPWALCPTLPSDQDPHQIAVMTVREKFLEKFQHQLGYAVSYSVEHWALGDDDELSVLVRATVAPRVKVSLYVGARGATIAAIARQAEEELASIFQTNVRLRINVTGSTEAQQQRRPAAERKA